VDHALRSHPLLTAGSERIAASAGLLRQAGLRPNPRATLQTENWRPYGNPSFRPGADTDTFAFLIQPLETAGKRERRRDLASAHVRRAELERELLARQIAGRVRQAYWNAAGAEKIRDLWVENGRNFQQIVEYHEIRVREGAMAEADLLKVRLEGERLAVAANSAALDAERARIQLFREMGQTSFPETPLGDALALEPAPPAADLGRALADRAELKLARQAIEQARVNVRLQQAMARPDLELMLGYKRATGFHTAIGGVQFGLPFFNRNQGAIAAAVADTRAGEAELAAAEAMVRAEVRAAQIEVEMRRRQIAELLVPSLGRAAESARIAQAAYREGGADLLRLLDAERLRIELEVLHYRTLAEYRQSVAALESALGVAP
jgi:outer membrane protein TolC